MNQWSLPGLVKGLQNDIENRLSIGRMTMGHSVAKGDATEAIWLELLRKYLPHRYKIDRAFVVDSNGKFSLQIDLVIYDRQYTPPIFDFSGEIILPAESVYAVFEVKQKINLEYVNEAKKKVASVRDLFRTSVAITNANTITPQAPKEPFPILGGILALENGWDTPMAENLESALMKPGAANGQLNTGCVAADGWFSQTKSDGYDIHQSGTATTAWLFDLIRRLQDLGTVPAIDMNAYAVGGKLLGSE